MLTPEVTELTRAGQPWVNGLAATVAPSVLVALETRPRYGADDVPDVDRRSTARLVKRRGTQPPRCPPATASSTPVGRREPNRRLAHRELTPSATPEAPALGLRSAPTPPAAQYRRPQRRRLAVVRSFRARRERLRRPPGHARTRRGSGVWPASRRLSHRPSEARAHERDAARGCASVGRAAGSVSRCAIGRRSHDLPSSLSAHARALLSHTASAVGQTAQRRTSGHRLGLRRPAFASRLGTYGQPVRREASDASENHRHPCRARRRVARQGCRADRV